MRISSHQDLRSRPQAFSNLVFLKVVIHQYSKDLLLFSLTLKRSEALHEFLA